MLDEQAGEAVVEAAPLEDVLQLDVTRLLGAQVAVRMRRVAAARQQLVVRRAALGQLLPLLAHAHDVRRQFALRLVEQHPDGLVPRLLLQ